MWIICAQNLNRAPCGHLCVSIIFMVSLRQSWRWCKMRVNFRGRIGVVLFYGGSSAVVALVLGACKFYKAYGRIDVWTYGKCGKCIHYRLSTIDYRLLSTRVRKPCVCKFISLKANSFQVQIWDLWQKMARGFHGCGEYLGQTSWLQLRAGSQLRDAGGTSALPDLNYC